MNSQKNIQDELRSLESSLPLKNIQPYSVPEGYFEAFSASVLAKIQAGGSPVTTELQELSPLLVSIPKKMPYSVPFSYFKENIEGMAVFSADEQSLILPSLEKTMPYSVPEGYFDGLPNKLLIQVAPSKAKVIPLFARTWMRVASAAVIAGALFLAGYQYFNKNQGNSFAKNGNGDTTQTLMANNAPRIEQAIKTVSTKELEEFIKNVQAPTENAAKAEPVLSGNEDVKDLLKDVSVGEMETFLSAIPTVDEDLFVTD